MRLTTLALVTLTFSPQQFEVPAAPLDWEDLSTETFDTNWLLPPQSNGRMLIDEMRKLAQLVYLDGGEQRTFGDLVVEARNVPQIDRASWLAGLEARAPKLVADWGAALQQLLIDDWLYSQSWKPGKDHDRDGILTAGHWNLASFEKNVWGKVQPRFEQAAVLCNSDLTTIKCVENDYKTYYDHIGADYMFIKPTRDGHRAGLDPKGEPFRYVRIGFQCDIPWPYSSYSCDLRILNRVGEDGVLLTDIFSPSPDFHYLAGRDVFLPVLNAQDEVVSYLLVREFGFDIDDVPDRAKHRAEALRSSLGNLKLKSERAFENTGAPFPTPQQALEALRVQGRD